MVDITLTKLQPTLDVGLQALGFMEHRSVSIATPRSPRYIGLVVDVERFISRFYPGSDIYVEMDGSPYFDLVRRIEHSKEPAYGKKVNINIDSRLKPEDSKVDTIGPTILYSGKQELKVFGGRGNGGTVRSVLSDYIEHHSPIPTGKLGLFFKKRKVFGLGLRFDPLYEEPAHMHGTEENPYYPVSTRMETELNPWVFNIVHDNVHWNSVGSELSLSMDYVADLVSVEKIALRSRIPVDLVRDNIQDRVRKALLLLDCMIKGDSTYAEFLTEIGQPGRYTGIVLKQALGSIGYVSNRRPERLIKAYNNFSKSRGGKEISMQDMLIAIENDRRRQR